MNAHQQRDAGQEAVRPLARTLVVAAQNSGDPREFWAGALGLLAGASAYHLGALGARDLLLEIASIAQHAAEGGHVPKVRV